MDVYQLCLTDNIMRFCWLRGYIQIIHGGGASMICQTSDIDHHHHARKRVLGMEGDIMVRKARERGGGLVG